MSLSGRSKQHVAFPRHWLRFELRTLRARSALCREKRCEVKRKRTSRKFQRMAVEQMRNCEDVREWRENWGAPGDIATSCHEILLF